MCWADAAARRYHHALYTPPGVVSPSEHARAEARIPEHVAALRALGVLDAAALRRHISKPLRPVWVTPDSPLASSSPEEESAGVGAVIFEDAHPVICCTSSRRVDPDDDDDDDGGGGGELGPRADGPLFWAHADALLAAPEAELPDLVRALVAADRTAAAAAAVETREEEEDDALCVAGCIYVRRLPASRDDDDKAMTTTMTCTVALVPRTTDRDTWARGPARIEVGLGAQPKLAGRRLRAALGVICDFVGAYLAQRRRQQQQSDDDGSGSGGGDGDGLKRVLVACETGRDLSVGVALALACRFLDDGGRYCPGAAAATAGGGRGVTKALVRTRLARIMLASPDANPSRTTLQSVNSYLMG
ncbi:putative initiator tRNA phosphoribosyl transferase [Rosellinia necatrix]|uniref:Putative initiator tRNA phosphoribosyl transferase n=1 Tax=Rosellinia necatrix TaxID=77044 RepID=A0A1S8A614_ROSNE|nr:putative initiator tRNA phosphoribosyl transferase [Rosellinia necatrix]